MNLKDLLFGGRISTIVRASAVSKTTDASPASFTSTRLFEASTITIALMVVAAVSFVLGFFFWALVVIFKRRQRVYQARLRDASAIIFTPHEDETRFTPQEQSIQEEAAQHQQNSIQPTSTLQAPQPAQQQHYSTPAAQIVQELHYLAPSNQSQSIPEAGVAKELYITRRGRESKIPQRFGSINNHF